MCHDVMACTLFYSWELLTSLILFALDDSVDLYVVYVVDHTHTDATRTKEERQTPSQGTTEMDNV